MDKDQQKQPLVIEFRKNYGTSASTATASSLEPGSANQQQQQQQQQQPQPHQLQQQRSIIYCVHGQLADSCCELANELSIRKIDSHCHKPRTEGIDKIARKKLIMASVLCIIFMIAEIIGGIYSNSLAIATDAAHLMADLASFMISLLALWIAARPSTKRLSFGWYRAEVLGALISVLMIWVVTAILFYMAVLRTISRDFELDGEVMLITSGLGILVNVIMGATLHHHGHSHGGGAHEGHSHEEENINVRAAFIHVLSDFVQSLGVFIAALVIYFKPEWNIIDPICTFLFSVLVLGTTIAIMKDAIVVLMEGTPKYLDYTEVMQTFLQIEGVVRVHNLRIWALSINKIALAAHLAVEPNTNTELVLRQATQTVHAKYRFFETTLQIEEFQPDMEDCNQCTNPI
ncbi:zinc transporter 2 [Anopheles darlingi]|nr:zinc transporter 2 [Anopheles darlingi]XP_049533230.1 zinc transporter 2 [Anopheles darlingi]XP_049533231.1 zinc transporter 2 [Anopheles darlingi]XP_049533232.1 zinc transporter 2 [Anopheles darlingi]XP_049533233.1 zinc transporter 2 [Anopheles darlingi]XP_049533234.1 zinc transporter 2 [Anopheles darlingi]XP_049533235.1 zinc transporter 2 [Anopheles darlingi]XP_049533236.1 zinc transporter 2 [Anopheles darlingi]